MHIQTAQGYEASMSSDFHNIMQHNNLTENQKTRVFDFKVKVNYATGLVGLSVPQFIPPAPVPSPFFEKRTYSMPTNISLGESMLTQEEEVECVICQRNFKQSQFQQHLDLHKNRTYHQIPHKNPDPFQIQNQRHSSTPQHHHEYSFQGPAKSWENLQSQQSPGFATQRRSEKQSFCQSQPYNSSRSLDAPQFQSGLQTREVIFNEILPPHVECVNKPTETKLQSVESHVYRRMETQEELTPPQSRKWTHIFDNSFSSIGSDASSYHAEPPQIENSFATNGKYSLPNTMTHKARPSEQSSNPKNSFQSRNSISESGSSNSKSIKSKIPVNYLAHQEFISLNSSKISHQSKHS